MGSIEGRAARTTQHASFRSSGYCIVYRHNDDGVFLYAFDLIELDGDDLRRHSLIVRKMTLVSVLAPAAPGLRLNQHLEADILDVFHHACKLGLEGIVSKQKGLPPTSHMRAVLSADAGTTRASTQQPSKRPRYSRLPASKLSSRHADVLLRSAERRSMVRLSCFWI